ncbi:MAG TPA: hypothetical protein VGR16_02310 [Thermomicrobiales bacterium]|nr:hypothetical protein [Thermomicrobiales bacterium]
MNAATHIPIRVDSEQELDAYLSARGSWQPAARRQSDNGTVELEAESETGEITRLTIRGRLTSTDGPAVRYGRPTTESLETLMTAAVAFSAENPPHHPGTLARFPVPSERFPGRVEVPLALIALEDRTPGIYAPPRVAVPDWATAEPLGVGEFPGFSPEGWPPPRLGDWPPSAVGRHSPRVLAASIARLSGCLVRLIDQSLGGMTGVEPSDISDARALLRRLDPPEMSRYYRMLSPRFADMLGL